MTGLYHNVYFNEIAPVVYNSKTGLYQIYQGSFFGWHHFIDQPFKYKPIILLEDE